MHRLSFLVMTLRYLNIQVIPTHYISCELLHPICFLKEFETKTSLIFARYGQSSHLSWNFPLWKFVIVSSSLDQMRHLIQDGGGCWHPYDLRATLRSLRDPWRL